MTAAALYQAVTETFDSVSADREDIRLLISRVPGEQYGPFLAFYRLTLARKGRATLTLLAETIAYFNDALIEAGELDEIIVDLEEKLSGLIPALLGLGFLSAGSPDMAWVLIQNRYRLIAGETMLLLDFTKTEFEAIQRIKLDRAVRLIYRDSGEFFPYAKAVLYSPPTLMV